MSFTHRAVYIGVLCVLVIALLNWKAITGGFATVNNEQVLEEPETLDALRLLEEITSVRVKTNSEGQVNSLSLTSDTMTDDLVPHLNSFQNLEILHLERSQITDAGLTELKDLPKLEQLFLDETKITDDGLASLADHKQLKLLSLADCKITDAGLVSISKLKQLESLNLNNAQLSDAGLAPLNELVHLRQLWLRSVGINGQGLSELSSVKSIQKLDLSNNSLDQSVSDFLGNLQELEQLFLAETSIDNDSIVRLTDVLVERTPKLRSLSLANTKLSDPAIEPLKKLSEFKDLAVVQLQGTAIEKQAFKQLAAAAPEINFSVNYSEEDE